MRHVPCVKHVLLQQIMPHIGGLYVEQICIFKNLKVLIFVSIPSVGESYDMYQIVRFSWRKIFLSIPSVGES